VIPAQDDREVEPDGLDVVERLQEADDVVVPQEVARELRQAEAQIQGLLLSGSLDPR
jgi:hypothetical protein